MMNQDIKEILITNAEIQKRTIELANQINIDYAGKKPVMLGLLKGSVPFMAELLKHIDLYCETEYMRVSSYGGGTESTGEIKILKDLDVSVMDRDVIIVEDIIDTGLTLATMLDLMKHRKVKSVEVVCLLNKPSRRKINVDVKYIGFEIPDKFVIGYGLDFDEFYRNLPYIGVLKEEKYIK